MSGIQSVLEAEPEASYPDSGLVMDSKDGSSDVKSVLVVSDPDWKIWVGQALFLVARYNRCVTPEHI